MCRGPDSGPELHAPIRAGGNAVGAMDVESVQILVSPPGQVGAAQNVPGLAAISAVSTDARVAELASESDALHKVVKSLGERLEGRLDSLQTLFEREQRAETARERVVDRLHAELQEYKQDLFLKVQRPIFIDLIQLHDDIGKMIEARTSENSEARDALPFRGVLESIQTGIEDILYRQGVEPFVVEGNDFDPRRQRAVSTVPTDDAATAKTVAARLRKGFQAGEKVIRPEIVTVYAFRQPRPLGASS